MQVQQPLLSAPHTTLGSVGIDIGGIAGCTVNSVHQPRASNLEGGRNIVAVTIPVVIGWGTRKRQEKWGCEFFSCWTLLRNLSFTS